MGEFIKRKNKWENSSNLSNASSALRTDSIDPVRKSSNLDQTEQRMSKLMRLEKLCDPASLAFEEEGSMSVEEVMKKIDEEAEASFTTMRVVEDEKLTTDMMDSNMAKLDEIAKYGSLELKTLAALETTTLKVPQPNRL